MTVGPYPLAPVITQLEGIPALKLVGVAADLQAALAAKPLAHPAAYVVLRENADKPHGYTGTHVQAAHASVIVVLWVLNYRTVATGESSADDMDTLDAAVRNALISFTPDDSGYEPLWFQGNQDDFKAGWLVRQVAFQSDYRIQV